MESYALIGGLAVSAWGIPRATQDLDFAIGVGTSRPDLVAIEMKGDYRPGSEDDPLRGVIDGYVEAKEGSVRFQLIMLPERLMRHVFESVRPMALMDCQVPVVSWQALVLLKLYGGGLRTDWMPNRFSRSSARPATSFARLLKRLKS